MASYTRFKNQNCLYGATTVISTGTKTGHQSDELFYGGANDCAVACDNNRASGGGCNSYMVNSAHSDTREHIYCSLLIMPVPVYTRYQCKPGRVVPCSTAGNPLPWWNTHQGNQFVGCSDTEPQWSDRFVDMFVHSSIEAYNNAPHWGRTYVDGCLEHPPNRHGCKYAWATSNNADVPCVWHIGDAQCSPMTDLTESGHDMIPSDPHYCEHTPEDTRSNACDPNIAPPPPAPAYTGPNSIHCATTNDFFGGWLTGGYSVRTCTTTADCQKDAFEAEYPPEWCAGCGSHAAAQTACLAGVHWGDFSWGEYRCSIPSYRCVDYSSRRRTEQQAANRSTLPPFL